MASENECVEELLSPKATATTPVTPRRSARKSVKPKLDYNDIVEKKILRSDTRKVIESEHTKNSSPPQHKWTPSEVGRISRSRRRKSKRISTKNCVEDVLHLVPDKKCDSKDIEGDENDVSIQNMDNCEYTKQTSTGYVHDEINDGLEKGVPKQKNTFLEEIMEIEENKKNQDIESIEVEDITQIDSDFPAKFEFEIIENVANSKDPVDHAINEGIGKKSVDYEWNEANTKLSSKNEASGIQSVDHEKNCENLNYENGSFGAYLKSKTIDISDLGLEPLESEENNDIMPSLLICDDDENQKEILNSGEEPSVKRSEEEPFLTEMEIENKNILNSTFDTEDSNVLFTQPESDSLSESRVDKKQNTTNKEKSFLTTTTNDDIIMQSLLISDDEDENTVVMGSEKSERNSDGVKFSANLQPTIKFVLTDENKQISTLFHCDLPQPGTAKTTSGNKYRQPTPHKAKLNLEFLKSESKLEKNNAFMQKNLNFAALEPREIVLRSIRKRSNSVSVNTPATRTVSFYSPANQILDIDDVDKLMAKSAKKLAKSQKEILVDRNVTKRRKRSISMDDNNLRISRIPKPIVTMVPLTKVNTAVDKQQPKKVTRKSIQKCRTKLPNFSAIHQKHFNEMENLVQHIERKAERAKILTNSNSKPRIASAQKKPIEKSDTASKTPNKKLELLFQAGPKFDLPKPRQILNKPFTNTKCSQPKPVETSRVKHAMKEPNKLVPADSRPPFTLSTQATSSMGTSKTRNYAEKAAERRQRYMDMFKGRTRAKRAENGESQRADIIRGVRSNRRFELQMQHRKNIEER